MIAIKQQQQLISNFKSLLKTENVADGTIRSYLSDTRHFLGWYELFLKANNQEVDNTIAMIGLIKNKNVVSYINYLTDNRIPRRTINRRLSSLRKFGVFCVNQGWLAENYFSFQKNVTNESAADEDKYYLNAYRQNLISRGISPQTVKNYLSDVRHFTNWVNS